MGCAHHAITTHVLQRRAGKTLCGAIGNIGMPVAFLDAIINYHHRTYRAGLELMGCVLDLVRGI